MLAITTFGPGGLLDDNDWPVRMNDGNYAGWYASAGGELSLEGLAWVGRRVNWGEPSTDSTVNLINSLGFFNAANPAGRLGGSLLAVDNGSVQPGLTNAVAVWDLSGATFSSADLEIAFDWPAAGLHLGGSLGRAVTACLSERGFVGRTEGKREVTLDGSRRFWLT